MLHQQMRCANLNNERLRTLLNPLQFSCSFWDLGKSLFGEAEIEVVVCKSTLQWVWGGACKMDLHATHVQGTLFGYKCVCVCLCVYVCVCVCARARVCRMEVKYFRTVGLKSNAAKLSLNASHAVMVL